jgi:hypothetical protein
MDWQQPVALGIVAMTAVWMLCRGCGVSVGSLGRRSACGGCPASGGRVVRDRLIYRARRGERAVLIHRGR